MTPALETTWTTVYQGHVLDVLKELPPGSAQACITSPPYWGLRDYGLPPVVWDDPGACDKHEWGATLPQDSRHRYTAANSGKEGVVARGNGYPTQRGAFCQRCSAWIGQLGLESHPQDFIRHLMQVMAALWRVLRNDGIALINLGDTFSGGGGYFPDAPSNRNGSKQSKNHGSIAGRKYTGIPPKSLCLIPQRFAIAAQEQGWIVRQVVPWVKRSAMPESTTDRPTNALEWWFMLVKQPHYFSDMEAVRMPGGNNTHHGFVLDRQKQFGTKAGKTGNHLNGNNQVHLSPGRAFRNTDLWFQSLEAPFGLVGVDEELVGLDITAHGYPHAHFATFPEPLIAPLLQMSTSEHGACSACGSPWRRLVEKARLQDGIIPVAGCWAQNAVGQIGANGIGHWRITSTTTTAGWEPTCSHPDAAVVPCTILDPFAGSGTVAAVATVHRRRSILIEQSAPYVALIQQRLAPRGGPPPPLAQQLDGLPLFAQQGPGTVDAQRAQGEDDGLVAPLGPQE